MPTTALIDPIVDDPIIKRNLDSLISFLNEFAGRFFWGTGTPEGNVAAPVGSVFFRTDGGAATTLYVKEANSTAVGWVGK